MAEYLTVEDAARRSRYSSKTIYRAIRQGHVRASKPAGRWRIHERDYETWMGSNQKAQTVEAAGLFPVPGAPAEVGSLERLRAMERDAT